MRLSQHLLRQEEIERFVDAADPKKSDVVFEIGAGPGNLTTHIANRCKKVIAIEIDRKFESQLKEVAARHGNIEVLIADVLTTGFSGNKVVGNLPFEISSPITEKVIRYMNENGGDATFIYQLEFAERMVAKGRSFSRLSFLCQYYANAEIMYKLPRGAFSPHPMVDCAVVRISPGKRGVNRKMLEFVNILFQQKNKKVMNSLLDSRFYFKASDKKQLRDELKTCLKESADDRVWELSPEEIVGLYKKIRPFIR